MTIAKFISALWILGLLGGLVVGASQGSQFCAVLLGAIVLVVLAICTMAAVEELLHG